MNYDKQDITSVLRAGLTYTRDDMVDIMITADVDMESAYGFESVEEAFYDLQQYIWFHNNLEARQRDGYKLPEPMTKEEIEKQEQEEQEREALRHCTRINGVLVPNHKIEKAVPRSNIVALANKQKRKNPDFHFVAITGLTDKSIEKYMKDNPDINIRLNNVEYPRQHASKAQIKMCEAIKQVQ